MFGVTFDSSFTSAITTKYRVAKRSSNHWHVALRGKDKQTLLTTYKQYIFYVAPIWSSGSSRTIKLAKISQSVQVQDVS